MSSKRGRSSTSNRSQGTGGQEAQERSFPMSIEYQTDDGFKVSIDPTEIEFGQEIEIDENNSIELAYGFDWSPVDFNVEKKGLDLSVSGEVGVPGDLLGVSGGLIIDLGKGEIVGGEVGVEIGTVDIEVGIEGDKGCKKSVSLGFAGFSVSYSRDDCDDDDEDRGNDAESQAVENNTGGFNPKKLPFEINPNCSYLMVFGGQVVGNYKYNGDGTVTATLTSGSVSGGFGRQTSGEFLHYYEYTSTYKSEGSTGTNRVAKSLTSNSNNNLDLVPGGINTGPDTSMSFLTVVVIWFASGNKVIEDMEGRYLASRNALYALGRDYLGYNLLTSPSQVSVSFLGMKQLLPCSEFVSGPKSRRLPLPPPSPPPRKIPMNDCCRESTKLMREIHKHLGIPELKKSGVSFPNRLIAPGAQGYSKVDNIVDFLELIVREIDHLGIHPHEVTIKDVDPGTPGDQSISAEFVNATAWAQALMENTLKSGGTDDARLNLQVRSARLLLQTFVTAVSGKYKADAIADFLGVPTQEFSAKPSVPFDITLGERRAKGFGKSETDRDKIKKLSVKKVEALLDRFLSESTQDVVCEQFDEREQSLLELLQQLVQRS